MKNEHRRRYTREFKLQALGMAETGGKSVDQIEDELISRPVFDVEAMRYYNEKLVSSLDILKTASIEARKIRDTAETEMRVLISQLGEAAAEVSTRNQ